MPTTAAQPAAEHPTTPNIITPAAAADLPPRPQGIRVLRAIPATTNVNDALTPESSGDQQKTAAPNKPDDTGHGDTAAAAASATTSASPTSPATESFLTSSAAHSPPRGLRAVLQLSRTSRHDADSHGIEAGPTGVVAAAAGATSLPGAGDRVDDGTIEVIVPASDEGTSRAVPARGLRGLLQLAHSDRASGHEVHPRTNHRIAPACMQSNSDGDGDDDDDGASKNDHARHFAAAEHAPEDTDDGASRVNVFTADTTTSTEVTPRAVDSNAAATKRCRANSITDTTPRSAPAAGATMDEAAVAAMVLPELRLDPVPLRRGGTAQSNGAGPPRPTNIVICPHTHDTLTSPLDAASPQRGFVSPQACNSADGNELNSAASAAFKITTTHASSPRSPSTMAPLAPPLPAHIVRITLASITGQDVPGGTGEAEVGLVGQVNQYLLLDVLGRGKQGTVYWGFDTRTNSEYVAVKVVARDQRSACDVPEVEVMKRLPLHPNVITLREIIDDRSKRHVYLVMDLFTPLVPPGGTTSTPRVTIRPPLLATYAVQLCDALQHCHDNGVIHRDVKPANLLIGSDDGATIVLADFGVAEAFNSGTEHVVRLRVGSLAYLAPELLLDCVSNNDGVDGKAVDMWALGVTLYELLFGQLPWSACDRDGLLVEAQNWEVVAVGKGGWMGILRGLLQRNPANRMTAPQLRDELVLLLQPHHDDVHGDYPAEAEGSAAAAADDRDGSDGSDDDLASGEL